MVTCLTHGDGTRGKGVGSWWPGFGGGGGVSGAKQLREGRVQKCAESFT